MKSYCTVMYPGYGDNQYWVGELDAAGQVSGFYSLTLHESVTSLDRDDMLYYVAVEEDGDDIRVQCVQQYMAWPKKDPQRRSVTSLIETGTLDIVETANAILASQAKQGKRPN